MQLASLAAEPQNSRTAAALSARFGPALPVGARPAAVLMLFGVLDSLASDHRAASASVSRDLDVLLLARASTLRAHPGQVAFPGGRIDPGDAGAVGAAVREAHEETGLDPAGVEVLGTLAEVPLAFSGHVVTPVLAWWQHPSPVRVVDAGESADVFRAPVADLLDPANRGVTVLRRDGREWRGPGFLVPRGDGEHLVWGFTGMLLDGLFELLGWSEPWDRSRVLPLEDPRVGSAALQPCVPSRPFAHSVARSASPGSTGPS
jgi:8-oxo-dGTP pyrophosphatase MutT (NUDIX family)